MACGRWESRRPGRQAVTQDWYQIRQGAANLFFQATAPKRRYRMVTTVVFLLRTPRDSGVICPTYPSSAAREISMTRISAGIDLGTTNSCLAVLQEDRPVVIPNNLGEPITPS